VSSDAARRAPLRRSAPCPVPGVVFGVEGLGLRVWGIVFRWRVSGVGFGVEGLGCRLWGSWFKAQGLRFRIWGFGFQGAGGERRPGLEALCERWEALDGFGRHCWASRYLHPEVLTCPLMQRVGPLYDGDPLPPPRSRFGRTIALYHYQHSDYPMVTSMSRPLLQAVHASGPSGTVAPLSRAWCSVWGLGFGVKGLG